MNFTQQYGKNRQRCQQNTFYYAVWQLLLYFDKEFPLKILSMYRNNEVLSCSEWKKDVIITDSKEYIRSARWNCMIFDFDPNVFFNWIIVIFFENNAIYLRWRWLQRENFYMECSIKIEESSSYSIVKWILSAPLRIFPILSSEIHLMLSYM